LLIDTCTKADDVAAFLSSFAFLFPVVCPAKAAEEGSDLSKSTKSSIPALVECLLDKFPFWATLDPRKAMHHVEVLILVFAGTELPC
jgi:hypothetical protein